MTTPYAEFDRAAWRDHADHAADVAARLPQGATLVATAEDIAAYARLAAHVYGEHLARWQDGIAAIGALGAHPAFAPGTRSADAVERYAAALKLGAGDPAATAGLAAAARVQAHCVATSALEFQGDLDGALAQFRAAQDAARAGLPDGEPAIRALAIAGNNLAAALEQRPARSAAETAAMLDAARIGRECWGRAGGWMETERAEHRWAKCLLAAGDARAALDHARLCLAGCEANGADAFERFFAHEVVALAQRAAGDAAGFAASRATAFALAAEVPADLKRWCEPALALLRAEVA